MNESNVYEVNFFLKMIGLLNITILYSIIVVLNTWIRIKINWVSNLIAKLIGLSSSSKAAKFTNGSGFTVVFGFSNSWFETLGAHLGVTSTSFALSRKYNYFDQIFHFKSLEKWFMKIK